MHVLYMIILENYINNERKNMRENYVHKNNNKIVNLPNVRRAV